MTWRIVSGSAPGTAHFENGTACQDHYTARIEKTPESMPVLSIFVADGAGSALHGGEGAQFAVETASKYVAQMASKGEFALNDEFAVGCMIAVRELIYSKAVKEKLKARDFACTLLGVVSSHQGTLILQIGDGAIALDFGSGLEIPIVPMSGEYANMTNFVTDEDAVGLLASSIIPRQPQKVAVFTDGLQRLAINMATNVAHEPFFAPFFDAILKTPQEMNELLHTALSEFLSSDSVNERTDDDKTLVLAMLME